MTTNHHTPIANGAAADSATINNPLSELDTNLTNHETRIGVLENEFPAASGNPTEYLDGDGNWTVPAGTGASVDGHLIKDEGVALPQRASIDFVGAGVTVTNEAGGTQVSIPGGGHIIQDEGVDLANQPRLNFVGTGVTVTNDGGANKTVVTIPNDHGGFSGLGDDDHPQYLLASGLREWDEQGGNPATPAAGKWKVYFKAGGLYIIDDAGTVVGPIVTDHGALSGLSDDDHPQYMQKGTAIEGMQLIWNSATSLSVGTGVCYAENGDRINITSTLTDAAFSRANSTWYHIYVYLSGGSPAMEVVTTAPVAWKGTAYSKTGDTTRRYIGSVKTDASANVINFEHTPANNQITYRLASQAVLLRVLSSGVATTATSVSCAGFVPVTVSLAYLRFFNSSDGAGHYGGATLTTTAYQITVNVGNTAPQSLYAFLNLDASQVIYYLLNGRTTGVSHIDVLGYIYKR